MTAWSDYSPSDQERAKAAYMKYLNMQHDIEDFKLTVYDKEWCLGWLACRSAALKAIQEREDRYAELKSDAVEGCQSCYCAVEKL
jgi:hypothetical protein